MINAYERSQHEIEAYESGQSDDGIYAADNVVDPAVLAQWKAAIEKENLDAIYAAVQAVRKAAELNLMSVEEIKKFIV